MHSSDEQTRRWPLAGTSVPGGVLVHDPAHRLEFTEWRADLLLASARHERRVVLHSSAQSRMSPALAAALTDVRGRWVVGDAAGTTWDGVSGRLVDLRDPLAEETKDRLSAPTFDLPQTSDATEVILAASIRHRAAVEPSYGAFLETFTTALGAAPATFGPFEPTEARWERIHLSRLVTRAPRARRLLAASGPSSPMRGSLLFRPTTFGTEEVVEAFVATDTDAEDLPQRVHAALEQAAASSFVLFAVVLSRRGHADLMRRPTRERTSSPLAVLIGPPGVRDLGMDLDAVVHRFGAVRVGRSRMPSVLFPFASVRDNWSQVREIVQALGEERIKALIGSSTARAT